MWPGLTKSANILLLCLMGSLFTTEKGTRMLIVLTAQRICSMVIMWAWGWMSERILARVFKAVSDM